MKRAGVREGEGKKEGKTKQMARSATFKYMFVLNGYVRRQEALMWKKNGKKSDIM